jgi:hypothetical protein
MSLQETKEYSPFECHQCEKINLDSKRQWGPILWSLLHGLAEKIGTTISVVNFNEVSTWRNFLETIEFLLPCEQCRSHAALWIRAHPLTPLNNLRSDQLKYWVKTWLWSFHSDVNHRLQKPTVAFETLSELYRNVAIASQFRLFEAIEKHIFSETNPNLDNWMGLVNFQKLYHTFAAIYGLPSHVVYKIQN